MTLITDRFTLLPKESGQKRERRRPVVGPQLDQVFRALAENCLDAVVLLAPDGSIQYASAAACALRGVAPEEMLGRDSLTWVDPEDLPRLREMFAELLTRPGGRAAVETRYMDGQGRWGWVEAVGTNLLHVPGVSSVVVYYRDVTERKNAETALREGEERFRFLTAHVQDLIVRLSPNGTYLYLSAASQELLGYAPEALVGHRIQELIHPEDLERVRLEAHHHGGLPDALELTYRVRHRNGDWRWFETRSTTVRDEQSGSVREYVAVSRDVTDRKRLEEELAIQAYQDAVTGLPNRKRFMDRLATALEQPQSRVALLFIDLDRFKLVNDALGHAAGDALLNTAGARFTRVLRPEDTLARFGGDEFAILMPGVQEEAEALRVAEGLLRELSEPFRIEGREAYISASIGVALTEPGQRTDAGDLLKHADIALYAAKGAGKARYVVFDESMSRAAAQRLQLETDLYHACAREQLELHYMPEVDLLTGDITGMEALLRWRHPERGLLVPADFLSIAEETGLIRGIGRWVLTTACQQIGQWNATRAERGSGEAPLVVSVNLSAAEFRDATLPEFLAQLLGETGIAPNSLRLELPERLLVEDLAHSMAMLRTLRELGVEVAIDDFGSGYSSLGYLRRLPVDFLKIDRTFVQELHSDDGSRSVMMAVADLANALSVDVTASGIETTEQRDELRRARCTRGQGHLYSQPVGAQEVGRLLQGRLGGG